MSTKKNKKAKTVEESELVPKEPKKKKNKEGKKLEATEDVMEPKKKVKKNKKLKVAIEEEVVKNGTIESEVNIKNEESDHDLLSDDETETPKKNNEHLSPLSAEPKIKMSKDDMKELITRMEELIPENDNLSYKSRINKINWDDIAFSSYTAENCKEVWKFLQKRTRRFRVLKEILNEAKEYISNPTEHRGKKIVHPDFPSKPQSHYLIFFNEMKAQIMKQNPKIDLGELSHKISQLYKNLEADKKQAYEDLAAQERAEYAKELNKFYENHPEVPRPPGKKVRSPKPLKEREVKPQKPRTPFNLYVESQMNKQAGTDVEKTAFREKCKEEWRKLSDKKKLVWINSAENMVEKYEEEVKNYLEEHPDYVPITKKTILTKDEKMLKERLSGKPEKPPNSAYSLFSRRMLQSEEIKHIIAKNRMTFISDQWKACSEEERNKYKQKALEMMEQYKIEYEKYVESLPEEKRALELQSTAPKRKAKVSESEASPPKKPRSEKKKKKSVKLAEPKTPPISVYQYFLSVFNSTNTKGSPKQAWKMLVPEKKKKYENELVRIKQEYMVDFEKFLNSLSKEELEEYSRGKQNLKQEDREITDSSESSDNEDEEDSDDE